MLVVSTIGSLSQTSKGVSIEDYSDGELLESNGETRVNRLKWAIPPTLTDTYLTDHYNVRVTFHETVEREHSAGIVIHVWYDSNLNRTLDSGEINMKFATIITEKKTV